MLVYFVMNILPNQTVAIDWVAVTSILAYNIIFVFGWLGPPWIYGPKIAPLKYRHVAGSLAACGEWFSTRAVVFGGGTSLKAVGPMIFIWPLVCCFLAAAYVHYYCPETIGRTLEEIDYLFAKSALRERMDARAARRRHSTKMIEVDMKKNSSA